MYQNYQVVESMAGNHQIYSLIRQYLTSKKIVLLITQEMYV